MVKFGDIETQIESTFVAAQGKAISKFLRTKLRVNTGYVNNMKKLLIT
jgi:hypothetical protein